MSPAANLTLPNLAKTLVTHFDEKTSTVKASSLNDAYKVLAFGQSLNDSELIKLCGAPSGSVLTLSYIPASKNGEITPDGIFVEVENSTYFEHAMQLIIHALPNKRRGVYIKLVMLKKNPTLSAIGGLILESMLVANDALTSNNLKISNYQMLAAGGRMWPEIGKSARRWDGFAVWPRYGFDMPLHQKTKDVITHFPYVPDFFRLSGGCNEVSSLLTLNKGQEFWDIAGDGWYMSFDTTPNSYSRKTLTSYLARKYS